MAKIRVAKKKEPLDPAAVQTLWSRAIKYVQTNIRHIAAIILVIALIAASTAAWTVSRAKAEQKALSLFSEALAAMQQRPDKQSDNSTGHEKALEKFKTVRNQHPSTKAGKASLFYAGVCAFHMKQYDDAIAYYKNFLENAGTNLNYLRSFAYEGMGYAHEMKQQYTEALVWFERQQKDGPAAITSKALLNLARCYEAQGDVNAACSRYKEFLEKYPASSLKDLAKLKTDALCKKTLS